MRQTTIDIHNPQEVAKVLSDFVNGAGRENIKEFITASMNDHPTSIQQKMGIAFGMIAEAAKRYEEKRWVDGRNEYSFKLAKEIMDKLETSEHDGDYHRLKLGVPLI